MWFGAAPRTDTKQTVYLNKIELRAEVMITIQSSIVNIIGCDLYDHFMSMRIFTLTVMRYSMKARKIMTSTP